MIVDTNISLSHWPFRRLPQDKTSALCDHLRSQGVVQAWAGNFDALLHRDVAACNEWLARECQQQTDGFLIPWGTVDPNLPDWQEDLRRCDEDYKMPGIRLFPNYHQYKLDSPEFGKLIEAVAQTPLIVQIVCTMEDPRTQHPLVSVPDVDSAPLAAIARQFPKLTFILANLFRGMTSRNFASQFNNINNVCCDIAMLEGVGAVHDLTKLVPLNRILFSSHAPLFYFESAQLKLQESDLGWYENKAICAENARSIIQ